MSVLLRPWSLHASMLMQGLFNAVHHCCHFSIHFSGLLGLSSPTSLC